MDCTKPAKISDDGLKRINRLQNEVISSSSGQNAVLVAYKKSSVPRKRCP